MSGQKAAAAAKQIEDDAIDAKLAAEAKQSHEDKIAALKMEKPDDDAAEKTAGAAEQSQDYGEARRHFGAVQDGAPRPMEEAPQDGGRIRLLMDVPFGEPFWTYGSWRKTRSYNAAQTRWEDTSFWAGSSGMRLAFTPIGWLPL